MFNNNYYMHDNDFYYRTQIINAFRMLWEQHGLWTRSFIISAAENLPDLQYVTDRLLRNPTDFGSYLLMFYGNDISKQFEKLLRDHLLIAAKLVNDAKKGDTNAADEDRKNWYENADEIARLLASINPYWSYDDWSYMMQTHLKLVEQEAIERIQGQYASDVALYDTIEKQALEMADTMSCGIMQQFGII